MQALKERYHDFESLDTTANAALSRLGVVVGAYLGLR
jgi:hypothetical protein